FAKANTVADHHARLALQDTERLAVRMLLMRVKERQNFKRLQRRSPLDMVAPGKKGFQVDCIGIVEADLTVDLFPENKGDIVLFGFGPALLIPRNQLLRLLLDQSDIQLDIPGQAGSGEVTAAHNARC